MQKICNFDLMYEYHCHDLFYKFYLAKYKLCWLIIPFLMKHNVFVTIFSMSFFSEFTVKSLNKVLWNIPRYMQRLCDYIQSVVTINHWIQWSTILEVLVEYNIRISCVKWFIIWSGRYQYTTNSSDSEYAVVYFNPSTSPPLGGFRCGFESVSAMVSFKPPQVNPNEYTL